MPADGTKETSIPLIECHACSAKATTKCQRCGALNCLAHVKPLYIGESHEFRCGQCHSAGEAQKLVMWVVFAIVILIFLGFLSQATWR